MWPADFQGVEGNCRYAELAAVVVLYLKGCVSK
jgi:hypothetical protein